MRHLAPCPAIPRDARFFRDVDVVCRQHFPLTLDVNYVGTDVAVYLDATPSAPALAAWRASVAAVTSSATPTAGENEKTILAQSVATALPRLTQIIDSAPAILARAQPTFSNLAGAQTAMRTLDTDVDSLVAAVRDMALYQRKIIRLIAGQLDGTD